MELREQIIKKWMDKAKDRYGPVRDGIGGVVEATDMLIGCGIIFDAFTTIHWGNIDSATNRKDMFSRDFQKKYNDEYDNFPDDFKEDLNKLSGLQIWDMRPRHRADEPKKIEDVKNLLQVMTIIYLVRNNLFHGTKDVINADDEQKIKLSATVLFRLLEHFCKIEK